MPHRKLERAMDKLRGYLMAPSQDVERDAAPNYAPSSGLPPHHTHQNTRSDLHFVVTSFESSNSLAETQFTQDDEMFAADCHNITMGASIRSGRHQPRQSTLYYMRAGHPGSPKSPETVTTDPRAQSPPRDEVHRPDWRSYTHQNGRAGSYYGHTRSSQHLKDRRFLQQNLIPPELGFAAASHQALQEFEAAKLDNMSLQQVINEKEARLNALREEVVRARARLANLEAGNEALRSALKQQHQEA